MPLSLHDALIPSWLQILGALDRLIDKADAFCTESNLAPETIIDARLADDMLPFAYQVKSAAVHSLGAIEGVRSGTFAPDFTEPPASFAAMKVRIAETVKALEAIDPAEMEGFIGKPVVFAIGERRMPFTSDVFLLSFSQPNFYFHATAAYAILRHKGIAIGKRDYMGQMRIAQS
ncbi:MAG: DUF1993 domain-containing protein [Blastomonas sp.]